MKVQVKVDLSSKKIFVYLFEDVILTISLEGLSSKTSKLHWCSTSVNVIRNIPSKKNIFLLYKTQRDETAGLWKLTVPIETPFTSLLDILCQKPDTQRPSYRINVPPCQEIGPSSPPTPTFSPSLSLSFSLPQSNQSMEGWTAAFVSFAPAIGHQVAS